MFAINLQARNKSLTAKLLQQGCRYHKQTSKDFLQIWSPTLWIGFYIQCWIKTLLHQDLSEPEFYDDLVYKFKKKL